MIKIAEIDIDEKVKSEIIRMIAEFRVELKALKGISSLPDTASSEKEFIEYCENKYPVYFYQQDKGDISGYMVLKNDKNVIWVESLYVKPRKQE